MKPKLHEMKSHPIFRQILTFNAKKAVEDFAELLKQEKISNKELKETIVLQALDELICNNVGTFHYDYDPGTVLYRSRIITDAKNVAEGNIRVEMKNNQFYCSGFDEPNSTEPPLFKTRAARNNIDGVSYMYLAEDPYTACAEVRPHNHSLVSLSKFILNKPVTVIDFKDDHGVSEFEDFEEKHDLLVAPLFTSIMRYYAIPFLDPSIYRVTQFITDYIRKAGFSGIRYQSSISAGTNLTLFNCHKSIISFESSELILSNSIEYHFVGLNDGQEIKCEKELKWNPQNLTAARKEIYDLVLRANTATK